MENKKTLAGNSAKKRKILLGTLIPLGCLTVAAAIVVPVVLTQYNKSNTFTENQVLNYNFNKSGKTMTGADYSELPSADAVAAIKKQMNKGNVKNFILASAQNVIRELKWALIINDPSNSNINNPILDKLIIEKNDYSDGTISYDYTIKFTQFGTYVMQLFEKVEFKALEMPNPNSLAFESTLSAANRKPLSRIDIHSIRIQTTNPLTINGFNETNRSVILNDNDKNLIVSVTDWDDHVVASSQFYADLIPTHLLNLYLDKQFKDVTFKTPIVVYGMADGTNATETNFPNKLYFLLDHEWTGLSKSDLYFESGMKDDFVADFTITQLSGPDSVGYDYGFKYTIDFTLNAPGYGSLYIHGNGDFEFLPDDMYFSLDKSSR